MVWSERAGHASELCHCAKDVEMSCVPFFFAFWLPFLVPAVPVAAICWFFGRRRVTWFKWEYTIIIVPYLIWVLFIMIEDKGKSLSNAVAEPFYLGCGVALACVARVVIGKKWKERTLAVSLFAAICLLGVALWGMTPTLPE